MKATGNIKVLFYNFSHLTVNPLNAMLSQQIQLMYAPQHSTAHRHNTTTHTLSVP